MKKIYILLFIIVSSCSVKQINKDNRFNSYETNSKVNLFLNGKDSISFNELKFCPYYDSNDLQKFLFQKYGKWNNSISVDRKYPFLVWSDLKLFDGSNELYTIAVSGEDLDYSLVEINGVYQKSKIIYCSAIVLNENDIDCFGANYTKKDSIVKMLIDGAKQIEFKDLAFEDELNKILIK
ncbi:hypothetical protein [Lutibacter sp.]|uniref:hypothetical protein n=1 Tax=Lutibacter sp. TaxID=1925666 RepID=UPI0035629291